MDSLQPSSSPSPGPAIVYQTNVVDYIPLRGRLPGDEGESEPLGVHTFSGPPWTHAENPRALDLLAMAAAPRGIPPSRDLVEEHRGDADPQLRPLHRLGDVAGDLLGRGLGDELLERLGGLALDRGRGPGHPLESLRDRLGPLLHRAEPLERRVHRGPHGLAAVH